MLSLVDIQNKVFKKNKIGGYSIEEVNSFFEEVIQSYQEIINENYALKDKMNILNENVQYYRTMETTIQNVLVVADKTAQDTKTSAYEKAEQIKKDAEQRAEKMIFSAQTQVSKILEKGRQEEFELSQRIEDLKRQYASYKIQFKQIIQSQLAMIEINEDKPLARQEPLFEQQEVAEENEFYTKEYMPVNDEELA